MRFIFKILAVGTALLAYLCGVAEWLLDIISGLIVMLALLAFWDKQFANGGILLFMAFLCSPVGLPAVAGWVLDRLVDLDYSLRRFITTP